MPACPACGQDNLEIARFCLACGTPLDETARPVREERRHVSVVFVDLVGFTGHSETLDPDPANASAIREWAVGYSEAIKPHALAGGYVNMMMDDGADRVRASYGDNYPRLAHVKAAHDPENVFSVNQNIKPA